MDFDPTDELTAVRELATRILTERVTHEHLSALDERGTWFDASVWRELADAGLLGIALPEDVGGGGLTELELHHLLEQVGACAGHLPILETVVLGALPIARFGSDAQRRTLLPEVVAGTRLLTAALPVDRDVEVAPSVTATRTDAGWALTGTVALVPIAQLAHRILLVVGDEAGARSVVLVDPTAVGVTLRTQTLTAEVPHAEVELDGVRITDDDLLGSAGGADEIVAWTRLRHDAAVASLVAGAAAAVLRLAADYTSEREQFSRPVATFQAVGHRVADAFIDAEAIRLTALQAAWRLAEGLPADDEVAIASWWAADAGHRVLHAAHHVHGGVGVDHDYPLHRYFGLIKRYEFAHGGAIQPLLRLGRTMATDLG